MFYCTQVDLRLILGLIFSRKQSDEWSMDNKVARVSVCFEKWNWQTRDILLEKDFRESKWVSACDHREREFRLFW